MQQAATKPQIDVTHRVLACYDAHATLLCQIHSLSLSLYLSVRVCTFPLLCERWYVNPAWYVDLLYI